MYEELKEKEKKPVNKVDIQIITSSIMVVAGIVITFIIEKSSEGTSNMMIVFLGCIVTFLGADQLSNALTIKRRMKKEAQQKAKKK